MILMVNFNQKKSIYHPFKWRTVHLSLLIGIFSNPDTKYIPPTLYYHDNEKINTFYSLIDKISHQRQTELCKASILYIWNCAHTVVPACNISQPGEQLSSANIVQFILQPVVTYFGPNSLMGSEDATPLMVMGMNPLSHWCGGSSSVVYILPIKIVTKQLIQGVYNQMKEWKRTFTCEKPFPPLQRSCLYRTNFTVLLCASST